MPVTMSGTPSPSKKGQMQEEEFAADSSPTGAGGSPGRIKTARKAGVPRRSATARASLASTESTYRTQQLLEAHKAMDDWNLEQKRRREEEYQQRQRARKQAEADRLAELG